MLPITGKLLVAFAAAAATLAIEIASDQLVLANQHWMLIGELAMALVVGSGVFVIERWRARYLAARLRAIRDMNCYVRNELQVLVAATQDVANTKSAAEIERAVDHIEWALRELLPGKVALGETAQPVTLPSRKLDRPT